MELSAPSVHLPAKSWNRINVELLSDAERDIEIARFVNATSFGQVQTYSVDSVTSLAEELRRNRPTPGQLNDIRIQFGRRRDDTAKFPFCGSCGVKHIPCGDDSRDILPFSLHRCEVLKLTSAQRVQLQKQNPLLKQTRSWYQVPGGRDDEVYHVHKEAIRDTQGLKTVYLCPRCRLAVTGDEIPPYSIATGVDYGAAHRNHLPRLSIVERMLIAPSRIYGSILQLRNDGGTTSSSYHALKGHVICVRHDGPQQLAAVLPNVDLVRDSLCVTFVGRNHNKIRDQLLPGQRCGALLSVNTTSVFRWLHVLKHTHSGFKDIRIDESAVDKLNGLTQALLDDAVVLDSAVAQQIVRLSHDIASVRASTISDGLQMQQIINAIDQDKEEQQQVLRRHYAHNLHLLSVQSHVQLETVCLEPANLPGKSANESLIAAALRMVNESKAAPTAVRNLRVAETGSELMSEFGGNNVLLASAFPTVFMLGDSCLPQSVLNRQQSRLLLLQFTNAASCEHRLLFSLGDQLRRATNISSAGSYIRTSSTGAQRLQQLINDERFAARLRIAAANPESADTTKLAQQLRGFLLAASPQLPYTPSARHSSVGRLMSLYFALGAGSIFLTIAPNDARCPHAIRLSFSSEHPTKFPWLPQNLPSALASGGKIVDTTLFCTTSELSELVTSNPVAAAEAFHRLVQDIFDIILGAPLTEHSRKTIPYHRRPVGIFGKTYAAYGTVETQGRGALHAHIIIWGGVPPVLLQAAASDQATAAEACTTLATMFQAALPLDSHVRVLLRKAGVELPPTSPDSVEQAIDLLAEVYQTHWHGATCRKGLFGASGCRMSFPANINNRGPAAVGEIADASPTYLRPVESTPWDENIYWGLDDVDYSSFPLPTDSDSQRCLIYELYRPLLRIHSWVQLIVMLERIPGTEGLITALDKLTVAEKAWIIRVLPKRNGLVVNFNPTLLYLLKCNQSCQLLGAESQSRSALFYLVKYITKDAFPLTHTLALVYEAQRAIHQYPSTAHDSGTPTRSAIHLVQRSLNMTNAKVEVADTQVASLLLNHPSELSSVDFVNTYWCSAVQFVHRRLNNNARHHFWDSDEPSADDPDDDTMPQDSATHDHQQPPATADAILQDLHSTENSEDSTTGMVFETPLGRVIVTQEQSYALRGGELSSTDITYIEYVSLISIIPRSTSDRASHFRPFNKTYEFDHRHPLSKTHVQQTVSKIRVPSFKPIPPKWPGNSLDAETGTILWTSADKRAAQRFMEFVLCMFVPWDPVKLTPIRELTASSFAALMAELNLGSRMDVAPSETRHPPTVLQVFLLGRIHNLARQMQIPNSIVKRYSSYRSNSRTLWATPHDASTLPPKSWATALLIPPESTVMEREEDRAAAEEAQRFLNSVANAQDERVLLTAEDRAQLSYVSATVAVVQALLPTDVAPACGSTSQSSIRSLAYPNAAPRLPHRWTYITEDNVAERTSVRSAITCPVRGTSAEDHSSDRPPLSSSSLNLPPLTIDTIDFSVLNEKQTFLARQVAQYLIQIRQGGELQQAPMFLVHGGPGVGKTHWITFIRQMAQSLNSDIICSAHPGSAASLIPSASTLCSMLTLTCFDSKRPSQPTASTSRVDNFRTADIFLIDEASMLGARMFAQIETRVRDFRRLAGKIAADDNRPFGGMAVILVGDFLQLPPVHDMSLPAAVCATFLGIGDVSDKPEIQRAASLFVMFKLFEFDEQMRATDPTHARVILGIRTRALTTTDEPFDDEALDHINNVVTTAALSDMDTPNPIVVTNHLERCELNWIRLRQFAKSRGLPIICWRLNIESPSDSDFVDKLSDEELASLFDNDQRFIGAFVAGAPACLTENIKPERGMANGTPVTLYSLSFSTNGADAKLQLQLLNNAIAAVAPGDIIWSQVPPSSINVAVSPTFHRFTEAESMTPLPLVVVPVALKCKKKLYKRVLIPLTNKVGHILVPEWGVQTTFSKTFHAVQGETLPRVTLDLNDATILPALTFSMAYVGISRVKELAHLTILPDPLRNAKPTLRHLKHLKPPIAIPIWYAGYMNSGWNRQNSLRFLSSLPASVLPRNFRR